MKTTYLKRISILVILLASILLKSYAQNSNPNKQTEDTAKYKVTFIELGSLRCIPCQQMQLVMKSIEKKYGNQVKVIFHDVWTPEGKPYADKYNIQMIPVQILLDENGKEFFRHEGYFSEEELTKVLNTKDVH